MTPEKSDQSPIDPAELKMARSPRDWTYRRVPRLRRYEAAGAGFDRSHPRTPNKLAGNAQNNLHLRSYGGLTAHLGG